MIVITRAQVLGFFRECPRLFAHGQTWSRSEMRTPQHTIAARSFSAHGHSSNLDPEYDDCRCASWRLNVEVLWR
jgi:hypothetical protein